MMRAKARMVGVRVPDPILNAIEAVAKKETRTLSSQVLHYVKRCLKQDGLLDEKEPDASASG